MTHGKGLRHTAICRRSVARLSLRFWTPARAASLARHTTRATLHAPGSYYRLNTGISRAQRGLSLFSSDFEPGGLAKKGNLLVVATAPAIAFRVLAFSRAGRSQQRSAPFISPASFVQPPARLTLIGAGDRFMAETAARPPWAENSPTSPPASTTVEAHHPMKRLAAEADGDSCHRLHRFYGLPGTY